MEWDGEVEFLSGLLDSGSVPKALIDRPAIFEHLIHVYDAFWVLTDDRSQSMTTIVSASGAQQVPVTGAIPFISIDRYATRFDVAGEDFERFLALIRRMDRAYLAWAREKTAG